MAYWIISLALIVFGFLGSWSIGQPFLLVGLAMLVLGVFRHRPLVFWPPMLAVIAYNIVYWAVAPFWCATSEAIGGTSRTVCRSLIGLRFEGEGIYNPSLMPAIVAGHVVAALVLVVAFALLWRDRREQWNAAAS
ncbi:MAG: hypothetical protein WEB29_08590 [Chloroflexota bacterium]